MPSQGFTVHFTWCVQLTVNLYSLLCNGIVHRIQAKNVNKCKTYFLSGKKKNLRPNIFFVIDFIHAGLDAVWPWASFRCTSCPMYIHIILISQRRVGQRSLSWYHLQYNIHII